MPDLSKLIAQEYAFFESVAQCEAFARSMIAPERVLQSWAYSLEMHECYVIARTGAKQIVYCATGFGPVGSWSLQPRGETDLGMESMWSSYLYECVVGTAIWPAVPDGFVLMGPGERTPVLGTEA